MSVIQAHAAADNPTPKPVTQPTRAFDRLQLPVLNTHLLNAGTLPAEHGGDASTPKDDGITFAALISLRRILTDHKSAFNAHDSGILSSLAGLADLVRGGGVASPDGVDRLEISRMATDALRMIMTSPALRTESIRHPAVCAALMKGIADGDDACRMLSYEALEAASIAHDAAASMVHAQFVHALVQRVPLELKLHGAHAAREDAPLLHVALRVLRALLRVRDAPAVAVALSHGAVGLLLQVASSHARITDPALAACAECLCELTFDVQGKREVIAHPGAVALLVSLCSFTPPLAAAAASVLMGVAIENDGKAAIIAAGVAPLVALVTPSSHAYGCACACRTLSVVAADPAGRAALGSSADSAALEAHLAACSKLSSPMVSRAATAALRTIQWKP